MSSKAYSLMSNIFSQPPRLGIIAGGQLAKMLIQEASKWDIATVVMDNDPHCPARQIASEYVQGKQQSPEDVIRFGQQVDVITYEIENINVQALKYLQNIGKQVIPDPSILEIIQNKAQQKQFLQQHNFPTSKFAFFQNKEEIINAILNHTLQFPFVQKSATGGYDGRGVAVVKSESDLTALLEGVSVVEEFVNIQKELSVIVARNKYGETACFPLVEMMFEPTAHLVDMLICPAQIETSVETQAREIAIGIAEKLNYLGVLAVEMFLDINGNILVNELAPRPHNSGHHTIEGCYTSQFEQHLRGIFNLPLGSTALKLPAVMINLLGEPQYEGPVFYQGLQSSLRVDGVKIHLYGKKITRPYRKMGHITILAPTIEQAIEKAKYVKSFVKVIVYE